MNKDMASFSPSDFDELYALGRSLVPSGTKGTFRLNEATSVGIHFMGDFNPGIGITLLDRTPEVVRRDLQLFPYTKLLVVTDSSHRPHFREKNGAQIRNEYGVLEEWNGGNDYRKLEQYSIENRPSSYPIPETVVPTELGQYVDPLKQVHAINIEDPFGRTFSEQYRERKALNNYYEHTDQLLLPDRKNIRYSQQNRGKFYRRRNTRFPGRHRAQMDYPMSNFNGIVRVQEENTGLLRIGIETVVYIFEGDGSQTVWQYKPRKADGRLGVTRYPTIYHYMGQNGNTNNPIEASDGEILVDILSKLH